jgi:hypothetical protein
MTHDKDEHDNEFVHFEEEEELRGDLDEILEEESEEELVISERPGIVAAPQSAPVARKPAAAKKAPVKRARKPTAKKSRARKKTRVSHRKAKAKKAKKKAVKKSSKRRRRR